MNTGELALLFVVALPLATVAAINLFLIVTGERDTLVLPLGPMGFPPVAMAEPRVELGCPRSELVDTGKHPVFAGEGEWPKAA